MPLWVILYSGLNDPLNDVRLTMDRRRVTCNLQSCVQRLSCESESVHCQQHHFNDTILTHNGDSCSHPFETVPLFQIDQTQSQYYFFFPLLIYVSIFSLLCLSASSALTPPRAIGGGRCEVKVITSPYLHSQRTESNGSNGANRPIGGRRGQRVFGYRSSPSTIRSN